MTCFLLAASFRPFNEDAFLCDPAKKKESIFEDLFRPVGVRPNPEPTIATPLNQHECPDSSQLHVLCAAPVHLPVHVTSYL